MWSVKCEVWSVKFEVWSAKSAVCSVRCGVSREGHGRDRLSLNYRSFIFGKLPPPACPGLCYFHFNWHEAILLSSQFSDKYIALLHSCDSQAARCVQAQSIHPLSASVRDMFSQKQMMIKWFSNVFQKDPSDPSGWHFRFTFLWTAIRVPWRQDHHAMDRPTSGFEANSSQ